MCGIAGFVNIDNIDINKVHKSLVHRGPDAHDSYTNNNVTLIHNRLAIQDLSTNASQPMCIKEYVIILNGEIYNHYELKKKLTEYNFKSNSDTETLLYLFIKYGPDCLHELDGMFAFSIFHIPSRKLFFARDRSGKKPLYYFQKDEKFFFASELGTIRENISLEVNEKHINAFLRLGFFYKEQTPYKNVYALPAGSYAWLNTDTMGIKINKWWDISDFYKREPISLSKNEVIERVDSHLNLAIKRRLESSDLEVGSFLSGGIDSGLIVAIAAHHKRDLKAFTVAFEGQYDESSLAKSVAKKYDLEHKIIHIDYSNLLNDIEKILMNYGEPFADSSAIPSYYVSREAKKYVTVILNGDGGDELFGGYRRYVPFSKINFFNIGRLNRMLIKSVSSILPYPDNKMSIYNYFYRLLSFSNKPNALELYLSTTTDIFEDYIDSFYNHEVGLDAINLDIMTLISNNKNGLNKIMNIDFDSVFCADLLVKMDIATMANSLEGRSPMLSKELLEFAPTLPTKYKVQKTKTKYILRQLSKKYLPSQYINQPKRGFEIPLKKWVDNELSEIIHDYLNKPELVTNFIQPKFVEGVLNKKISMQSEKRAKILWSLFVTEVWYRNSFKTAL